MEMNILVTGGAGFIGSHLVNTLANQGLKITVLDNFQKGKINNILNKRKSTENIKVIKIDITDNSTNLPDIIKRDDITLVYHLAAITSVHECENNREKAFKVNVEGTLKILEACIKATNNKVTLVFSSSAAVYGDIPAVAVTEEHECNPISFYGFTKLMAEELIKTYSTNYGLKSIILRIFNVFGRKDSEIEHAGVVDKFITNALTGEEIIIRGDGNQVRDFIHVDDVVSTLILASRYSERMNNPWSIFNIGSGRGLSINQLAEAVIKAANLRRERVTYFPAQKYDIKYSVADITKARKILGFSPRITPEEWINNRIKSGNIGKGGDV